MFGAKTFVKSLGTVLMSGVFVAVAVLSPIATSVSAQQLPPSVTAYSSITVKVDGVSYKTLYNFTTDLLNDELWYPGVAATTLVSGPVNPPSKTGTKYIQTSYYNGIELNSNIEVKGSIPNFYHFAVGAGPIASYDAYYTFNPNRTGGSFTLTTKFVSPGITEENLTESLTVAMQNILDHFNATGTIRMNFLHIVE